MKKEAIQIMLPVFAAILVCVGLAIIGQRILPQTMPSGGSCAVCDWQK